MRKLSSIFWLILTLCLYTTCSAQATPAQPLASSSANTQINHTTLDLTIQAISLDLDNANLSLDQVQQTIASTKQNLQTYQDQLQILQSSNQSDQTNLTYKKSILLEKIANLKQLLTLDHQREENLKKIIPLLNHQLNVEKNRFSNLNREAEHTAHLAHEKQVQQAIQKLSEEQNYWFNQITQLNKSLANANTALSPDAYTQIMQKIFVAEENTTLTQFKTSLLRNSNTLESITDTNLSGASTTELYDTRQALNLLTEDLNQTNAIVKRKIHLLEQRQDLLVTETANPDETKVLENFTNAYATILAQTQILLTNASDLQNKTTTLLAKALARRQGLPGFSLEKWTGLLDDFNQMVSLSGHIFINNLHTIFYKLHDSDMMLKLKVITLPILAFAIYVFLRSCLTNLLQGLLKYPNTIFHNFLKTIVKIILAHLWYILLFIAGLSFLSVLNIGNPGWIIVFHLGNCILAFSVALMTARIALRDSSQQNNGDDIRLYHRLRWLFVFGFVVGASMFLAQDLDTSYLSQDLFARLFMLFVFVSGILLLRGRNIVPDIVIPLINPKRSYLIKTIKFLGVLIPLIILSNAVIGLLGYVDLAWTISRYEGLFLLVNTAYLLLRGVINEVISIYSTRLIRVRGGWILAQAFLNPLALWLHIILFVLSAWFLFYLYGLMHQVLFLNYFYSTLHFPLMRFSNHSMTIWVLLKACIAGMFFVWATKWSREFCYRKLYRKVKDVGARNSLAIFSQYGVVVIGLLITLKILQIDLTALTFIATGLALGVGFGLRDLANNFICGLVILIERPMQSGNTVTVGDYEGTVVNIGIRAITILGSDNKEIVVPNADVFSKPFINWTRQDDVVRYQVPIKVRWQDDPNKLCEEIKYVTLQTKNVLSTPEPIILLTTMNDGLLELEIRYYIHYNLAPSAQTRSALLFNIWERLAEIGVHPPYPTRRVLVEKDDADGK